MFDTSMLYSLPEGIETRWASAENPKGEKGKAAQRNHGRKGSAFTSIKAGERFTMAEVEGSGGTVRRVWSTISDRDAGMLRGLRLDFYWDGADEPAVSAPFGDFFGIGLGRTAPFQSFLFSNPEGRSFNCYAPMPFRTGMKLVVTNESGKDLEAFFYKVDYTVGDEHGGDTPYFHAHFRRENPTRMQKDYEILPKVNGRGRFLGCNIGVIADRQSFKKSWWGEGEVKVYIDGDDELPTLCGTGTEDYIGTGWAQGCFSHLYQGCTVADDESMQYCYYRHHIPDPIYFRSDVRVTIQQIGWCEPETYAALRAEGKTVYSTGMKPIELPEYNGLIERCDDYSSCAYFYLDRPVNSLPAMDPYEKRV